MGKYAEYGRELHTLPHRDNLDANDSLLFYQSGEYKQLELNKIRALQAGIELNVTAPEGSVISVSGEDMETFSKIGGTVQFSLAGVGTYTVSATKDGMSASETLVVDSIKVYDVTLEYYHIYGIRRDQNSSSPEWTRTDEAVGFEAVASVGNTTVGHSDFDDKYPWCDMKRYIMSTNDVMVYIPEFYYKRVVDSNGIETIQIATAPVDGFTKHPGSGTYVGAYLMGQGYTSISNSAPLVYQSRSTARTSVQAKGLGWQLFTVSIYSAIQMLYLVEFANSNSQSTIGSGWSSSRSNDVNTGSCDSMTYQTGASVNSYGNCEVIYRGIECLWGNSWEIIDGLNLYSTTCYVCTNPENFAENTSTNYDQISESLIAYSSYNYSNAFIYDSNNSWVMLPTIKSNVSASDSAGGTCDIVYVASGWNFPCISSSHDNGNWCGLFALRAYNSANSKWISSRIAYYPALDPNNTTTVTDEWVYSN